MVTLSMHASSVDESVRLTPVFNSVSAPTKWNS